jgi:hypothetical protein
VCLRFFDFGDTLQAYLQGKRHRKGPKMPTNCGSPVWGLHDIEDLLGAVAPVANEIHDLRRRLVQAKEEAREVVV